jgi:hypothetical protein
MNKKNLAVSVTAAPIGADLIREFLKKLPQKAEVLGLKGNRNAEHSAIYLVYSIGGSIFKTSFSTKGGTVCK